MPFKPNLATISRDHFSRLSQNAQLDVLRSLDARQKTRLLVDAANGAELMASLSPQEVYLLAVERGPEQLSELLNLATPEQWNGFFDLDCWHGDRFDAARTHRWLIALLQTDEDAALAVLREMNFELLVLILKAELKILAGPEANEGGNDGGRENTTAAGGGYEIAYHNENSAKLFGRILDLLRHNEPDFYRYLLEAVRAETSGMIEESVYQQRIGRLQDMGIPEPFQARRVYAWLDPERYRHQRPTKLSPGTCAGSAPGFTVTLTRPRGLLAEVLADGVDETLAWEMAHLANKVMMADGIEMGDMAQVTGVVAKVNANLNLALTWLSGQDVAAAGRYLTECYSEDLFRLGFSLTERLRRRAAAIVHSSVAPYLDDRAQACLTALGGNPPLFFEGVSDASRTGARLFETLAELQAVESWLDKMELQQQLFEATLHFNLPNPAELDLSGCLPEQAEDLTLVEFFLTALANQLLGRDFLPLPIAETELAGLHAMVSRSGKLHPRLREETVKWIELLLPGGGQFATYCLDIWEEEFCEIDGQDIDPRFVSGLIVRLADNPEK